jgi:ABC-2 type transport system ATP-binding protein
MTDAVLIEHLSYAYDERPALDDVGLKVSSGEIYGLLGPNGGGKTTLFRILSTHLRPQSGTVRVLGHDVVEEAHEVRKRCGVVFQRPGLDPKLRVAENLRHHGWLYGLWGRVLENRIDALLATFRLEDRRRDLVETLSGGLQRRVELAKAMIHSPDLLVFDEPSTGLDPGVRLAFWQDLERLRAESGVTVVLTTHFLEEAERCDRIGLMSQGRLVAEGAPADLRKRLGEDVVLIRAGDPESLRASIEAATRIRATVVDGIIRISDSGGAGRIAGLYDRFSDQIESLTIGRPTLEDVFISETGRGFEFEAPEGDEKTVGENKVRESEVRESKAEENDG